MDDETAAERELRQAEAHLDTVMDAEDAVQERFDENEATQSELDDAATDRKAAEAKRDHWRDAVDYERSSRGS